MKHKNQKSSHVKSTLMTSFSLISLALSNALYAQDIDKADELATQEDKADTEVISVTGSRIFGVAPVSPIVTLTSEDFEKRGLKSAEDVMRYLPQNFATTNSSGTAAGRTPPGAIGLAAVNLRGLGEGATLILVNGKRISAAAIEGANSFTDISSIPFAAIERVEVITDGASAVYGSDAVAGVVNFILKEDYVGYQITARYDNGSNGGDVISIEQTGGYSWDSGNITASLTYKDSDSIKSKDAGLINTADHRDRGGRFFPDRGTGGRGLLDGRGFATAPAGTLYAILPEGDGTNVTEADLIFVTQDDIDNRTANAALLPTENAQYRNEAVGEDENIGLHMSLLQDIGEDFELSLTGIYAKRKTVTTYDYLASSVVFPSSIYSNFSGPVRVLNYNFENEVANGLAPPAVGNNESERMNLTGTLDWSLPYKDWVAEFSFSTGKDTNSSDRYEVLARTGLPTPFTESTRTADPTLALNVFGDGSVQRPTLDGIIEQGFRGDRVGKQTTYSFGLNGSILTMPSGELKYSIGAESRTEKKDFTDYVSNPIGGQFSQELQGFVPEADNKAYFAELFIPLVNKEMDIPFVKDFALQLATRYDSYEFVGPFESGINDQSTFSKRTFSDTVDKVGLLWIPNDEAKVTFSWGEAFKAPSISELFKPSIIRPVRIFDAKNPGGAASIFTDQITGGNPDLKSENSVSRVIAFDYNPEWLDGFHLNLVWNNTEYTDLLARPGDLFPFGTLYFIENEESFPEFVKRDETGALEEYSVFRITNLASRESESLDILAEYDFSTEIGDFTVGIFATHTLEFTTIAAKGSDVIDLTGTQDAPSDWQGNLTVDWNNDNWSANVRYQYSSGYRINDDEALKPNVGSFGKLDVQVSYHNTQDGWNISGGINNLLDPDIPFVDNQFGYDSQRVNFQGRVIYLSMSKSFEF